MSFNVQITGVCQVRDVRANGTISREYTTSEPGAHYAVETRPDRVRTRRPPGWLYPKAYSLSRDVVRRCSGYAATYAALGAQYSDFNGTLPAGYHFTTRGPLSAPTGYKNECEIKALLALKDSKVNLGVAFAECQQTADLVGSVAGRIGKSYKALRRGNFRQAAQQLGLNPKVAPRHWLELQYGWKPLLSDVKGAVDALSASPRYHWVVTAVGKKGKPISYEKYQSTSGQGSSSVRDSYVDFQGGYCRLDYEPGNTFFSALSSVGLTNPFEVVWEKVPYSFIVDWFLPVGDWLSTLDAAYGFTFKCGSFSAFARRRVSIVGRTTPWTFRAQYSGYESYVRLSRTVYSSSPYPMPPGFKNPISLDHTANGFSLLSQAFNAPSPFRKVR